MSAVIVKSGNNRTISAYLTAEPQTAYTIGQVDVTASTDFLGHVKSVQLPQPETEEIDVTDYDSPEGAKEFEQGSVDFGSANTVRNINDTEYESAMDLAAAGNTMILTIIGKNKAGTEFMKRQGKCFVKYPSIANTEVNGVLEVTTEYRMTGNFAKFTGTVS
jgi:hypothetical protein